jgi:endonuclease/exonuclease/phosphatase family metal-dependent hydrolase
MGNPWKQEIKQQVMSMTTSIDRKLILPDQDRDKGLNYSFAGVMLRVLLLSRNTALPVHLLILLLALFASGTHAQTPLRVMTLNAEWLWTPHDGKADGEQVKQRDPSAQDYARELDFYVGVIRQQQVSLVALSEIEHGGVAADLAEKLGASWQSHFMQGRDTATGQDVAILSRIPIIPGSVSTLDFPEGRLPGDKKGKRLSKFLALQLELDGQKVAILTAHLLSRRNDNAKKSLDRKRQAQAMMDAVSQMRRHTSRIILLGDMNATQHTEELAILQDKGRLQVAEQACANVRANPPRSTVDQVLFDGFSCREYQRIDLQQFSDHEAVLAVFD